MKHRAPAGSTTTPKGPLFLTLLLMLLTMSTQTAWADDSGSCGESVTWQYNEQAHTLTISGSGAMTDYDSSEAPWYQYRNSITTAVIENGVTTIGNDAFNYCSSLTSVTIPGSVTTIGNDAFNYCSSLTSVTIPGSVTTIGNYAFNYCSSLTSVTIPASVTTIGNGAFRSCTHLTSVTIPGSVTTIGNDAFYSCSSLTSVTIPASVTTIGNSAFSSCSRLTSVTIPSSVTTIGDHAFYHCSRLTLVFILANELSSYGSNAFNNCASSLMIYVPRGRVNTYKAEWPNYSINEFTNAGDCGTDVHWAYARNTLIIYGSGAMTDYPSTRPWSQYVSSITTAVIVNGVTTIGNNAFYHCSSLTSVTIPASVTTIGNYAFQGCSPLTSVTIPASVTTIGSNAFGGCTLLTSVTIPGSVTTIGNGAFGSCSSLASVTIPASVTTIGDRAFSTCSSLTSVFILGSELSSYGSDVFKGNASDRMIYVPKESVETYKTNWPAYENSIASFHPLTLSENITATGNGVFTWQETTYAGAGSAIALSNTAPEPPLGYQNSYAVNDVVYPTESNGSCTFTMPEEEAKVSIVLTPADWATEGNSGDSEEQAFVIYNKEQFDLLALRVSSGTGDDYAANGYNGKYFKLGADIGTSQQPVSSMVGSLGHEFCGHFNGNGHTLTIQYGTEEQPLDEQFVAPFVAVEHGPTFSNLTINGNIYVDYKDSNTDLGAGGLIGHVFGSVEVKNCVSNVVLNSTRDRVGGFVGLCDHAVSFVNCKSSAVVTCAGSGSGFVGWSRKSEYTISFEGCLFNGKVLKMKNGEGEGNGSFVGWKGDVKTVNIKHCLVDLAALGENEEMATDLSSTFARNDTYPANITNSYYTQTLGSPQGEKGYTTAILPTNIGGEGTAYSVSGITAYEHGLLCGELYYMKPEAVSLADAEENDVEAISGWFATVTLDGRTLYKDGKWNTLCLPFSMEAEQMAASTHLKGATLMTLDVTQKNGFDAADGTLYLTFKKATAIEAGVPYLVKWAKAADYDSNPSAYDIANPVFEGVTISSTEAQAVASTTEGLETVQMAGSYSPVSVTADDKSILFLSDANTLYYSAVNRQMRSCRAHFYVPYIKEHTGVQARSFALSFAGEGATAIVSLTADAEQMNDDAWYSIDGVRLSGKPTQRGIYINHGKKTVIK